MHIWIPSINIDQFQIHDKKTLLCPNQIKYKSQINSNIKSNQKQRNSQLHNTMPIMMSLNWAWHHYDKFIIYLFIYRVRLCFNIKFLFSSIDFGCTGRALNVRQSVCENFALVSTANSCCLLVCNHTVHCTVCKLWSKNNNYPNCDWIETWSCIFILHWLTMSCEQLFFTAFSYFSFILFLF